MLNGLDRPFGRHAVSSPVPTASFPLLFSSSCSLSPVPAQEFDCWSKSGSSAAVSFAPQRKKNQKPCQANSHDGPVMFWLFLTPPRKKRLYRRWPHFLPETTKKKKNQSELKAEMTLAVRWLCRRRKAFRTKLNEANGLRAGTQFRPIPLRVDEKLTLSQWTSCFNRPSPLISTQIDVFSATSRP